jgi:hypothetical protein
MLIDRLIEIGIKANPKNNMSMGYQVTLMKAEIEKCYDLTEKQTHNYVSYACEVLNKRGFKYYTPELLLAK